MSAACEAGGPVHGKMRTLAIRVVPIACVFAMVAFLASPSRPLWEIWGLFVVWILSDLPEARAARSLTGDERAAIRVASGARTAGYVGFVLLGGIGMLLASTGYVTGPIGYAVAIVVPISVLNFGTSLLAWRRLGQVQALTAYRRGFLLTIVLQVVFLGVALWMGLRQ